MNDWTEVRRAVLAEGLSKREACRRFGLHWDTLQRMLEHAAPPGYQRVAKADRPVIGPWLGRLTGAMLDRLTHRVHIVEANGRSYRLGDSQRRLRRRRKAQATE